jgi:phosphoribosylaminoimidazole-succinocarboxamide synthase
MSTETQDVPKIERLDGLHLLHQGKVRDIYAIDENTLLLVTTDRVSAYDVILPQRIEGKGLVLNSLSKFWFEQTTDLLENHLIETDVSKMPESVVKNADVLKGRTVLVHRAQPLQAEFIVRGYLAGSGWSEYCESGTVCGHALPAGLQQCDRLPEPILTPSTKAPSGQHDAPLTIPQLAHIVGPKIATKAGALALALYDHAAALALSKGIILADTKIEFGLVHDNLTLIDEVFTPDSSRYWAVDKYEPGRDQESFDKQIVRNALLELGWDKTPPAPMLSEDVIKRARDRYFEIHRVLTGGEPS